MRGRFELTSDWEEASRAAAELLGLPDSDLPPYPEPTAPPPLEGASEGSKRKSPEPEDGEEEKGKKKRGGKKGKKATAPPPPPPPGGPPAGPNAAAVQAAQAFMSVFDPRSLAAPELPDTEGMGKILLERRKEAVREQYGV